MKKDVKNRCSSKNTCDSSNKFFKLNIFDVATLISTLIKRNIIYSFLSDNYKPELCGHRKIKAPLTLVLCQAIRKLC